MKFFITKPYFISALSLVVLLVVYTNSVKAQSKEIIDVDLDKIPRRIIRPCCAFGYDLKLWGVPFVTIDQVISIDDLGEHYYMGHKTEGVGTIYTHRGGFIDFGHLRDQLDWTRYLYTLISKSRGKGKVILPLRNEAGRKTLYLYVPSDFEDDDCILLAAKITYDLSLWHEISTWFGASTLPILPEKFSSFSLEDVYSNLLGIHIGMKTLKSKLPFNQAATKIIASTLDSLAVVKTSQETYTAYDSVYDLWYTSKKRIPKLGVTLKRDTDVLTSSRPWIVSNFTKSIASPVILEVPLVNTKKEMLTNFYQFVIDLNYRIPVKEIFPDRKNKRINQDDFGVLLNRIANDLKVKL